MKKLFNLYILFVKIGAILIGGGYVILPILKKELIEKRELLTEHELVDYYTISQSLPGLIAINISIFTGYKLHRALGALITVLGIITAPFLCIVIISSVIATLTNSYIIKNILWGVEFGVIILILSSIFEVWAKSITNLISFILFIIYLTLILFFKLSPTSVIIISIVTGLIFKRILIEENSNDSN